MYFTYFLVKKNYINENLLKFEIRDFIDNISKSLKFKLNNIC